MNLFKGFFYLFVSYFVLFCVCLMKVPMLAILRIQKMDGNMEESPEQGKAEKPFLDVYPKLLPGRGRLV